MKKIFNLFAIFTLLILLTACTYRVKYGDLEYALNNLENITDAYVVTTNDNLK